MTPGCTKEACAFRDAQRLDFPLLSDTDKAVARKYGAFGEKLMYGRKLLGVIRATFIIDGQGIVRKVFPRVRVEGHAAQVLQALKEL
jgi:peroxiredoxin Q/BCP